MGYSFGLCLNVRQDCTGWVKGRLRGVDYFAVKRHNFIMDGRDEKGRFLTGSQFWLARSRHGMKPKFSSPEMLWESCVDYFQWCEDHPLYEDKVGFYEGVAVHTSAAKMRAMTIEGLCIFIDITSRQWRDWREEQPHLVPVMVVAEDIIRTQKFTGAAAGLLNANIIARDLGLVDKTEGSVDANITVHSSEESMKRLAFLLRKNAPP